MSAKTFILVGGVLKDMRPAVNSPLYTYWRELVIKMAGLFEAQADKFDRQRFYHTCGMD